MLELEKNIIIFYYNSLSLEYFAKFANAIISIYIGFDQAKKLDDQRLFFFFKLITCILYN